MSEPKVIVSLTSHTAERLKNLPFFLYSSIFKYNFDYVKVVLTLFNEDVKFIPDPLHKMIDAGLVELIVADINLRCHLKYFYAMRKYRTLPVITIDDDSIYPARMIPDLLAAAEKYPNTIIARSARVIDINQSYDCWFECNEGVESVHWRGLWDVVLPNLNPEGYGGILYPANILAIHDNMIPEILTIPRADDIFLTVIEQRNRIKSIIPYYNYNKLDVCTKGDYALSVASDFIAMNNDIIARYRGELCK